MQNRTMGLDTNLNREENDKSPEPEMPPSQGASLFTLSHLFRLYSSETIPKQPCFI
jgi:hypothetical protein